MILETETIPIILSADHKYLMPLGVTIKSIIDNKDKETKLKIIILDGGLEDEDKKIISSLAKENAKIEYQVINKNNFSDFPEKRYFSLAAIYRLIAPEIFDYKKILYLDCDTIVLKDLSSLYKTDISNYILAAIREKSEAYVKKYFFREISRYFNSGVLLINTEKWRQEKIWQKSINFIKENKNIVKYPDQDTLNHLLENNWLELNKVFNFQLDKHEPLHKELDINILHFVGARKPWHYLYKNPYKKYFLKYLNSSPWSAYVYPDKNIKTVIQKQIIEPLFLITKNIIKKTAPKKAIKIMKNIFWYFSNKKDSQKN